MYDGEYCILREETVRERRGSYSGFCCRLYPFICWIIIKEGPGNFSGGRSPHWVNHVNLCLSCIVCLLCFCFCICFILLLRSPIFLTLKTPQRLVWKKRNHLTGSTSLLTLRKPQNNGFWRGALPYPLEGSAGTP
jgi:hypothetical protein